MRTTGVRISRATMAGLAGCLLVLAACGQGGSGAKTQASLQIVPVVAPLDTTLVTPAGSWAVIAMGDLSERTNTFWQLFFRAPGGSHWSLVTPPGVADNGGLVITAEPSGRLTAGIEPSQLLKFSPLASSTNGGRTWGAGVVPVGLSLFPDALATGAGGALLALVRAHDGQVLSGGGGSLAWGSVLTGAELASLPAGQSCGVGELTAVASVAPDSSAGGGAPAAGTIDGAAGVVGASCQRNGVVGVFVRSAGTWDRVGPTLTGALAKTPTKVLALSSAAPGSAAGSAPSSAPGHAQSGLVAGGTSSSEAVAAFWASSPRGPYSVSPPLSLGSRGSLVSSGVANGDESWVLVSHSAGPLVLDTITPGTSWRQTPDLPSGTATVLIRPGGKLDALAVTRTKFSDWALDASNGSWRKLQTIAVPINYGSSA